MSSYYPFLIYLQTWWSCQSACNNGASCVHGIKRCKLNCTAGFSRLCCKTAKKKMYEIEHWDHTVNIHASSLHKTLMFPVVKKYHRQRKYKLKSCSNFRRKAKINRRCITWPLRVFLLDIDDCVNHTCANGGSCMDGINNYSCNCLVGFTGSSCETGRCATEDTYVKPNPPVSYKFFYCSFAVYSQTLMTVWATHAQTLYPG